MGNIFDIQGVGMPLYSLFWNLGNAVKCIFILLSTSALLSTSSIPTGEGGEEWFLAYCHSILFLCILSINALIHIPLHLFCHMFLGGKEGGGGLTSVKYLVIIYICSSCHCFIKYVVVNYNTFKLCVGHFVLKICLF